MNTVQAPLASLSILAPCRSLPAEGDELQNATHAASFSALLRAYQHLVAARAPVFILKNGDVAWEGDIEELSALQLVAVSSASEGGGLEIESRYAMSRIDWAGVMSQVAKAVSHEHFISTPEEMLRVFASAVRAEAARASAAFRGNAVPLLGVERHAQDGSITVRFAGIWLAGDEAAEVAARDGGCVLLDHEAEGRGLKEAMVAAVMLAMVFEGTAGAVESPSNGKAKTSWFASIFGGGSSGSSERQGKGDVLKVTSQRLVQAPPRIYRSVLDNPSGGALKVVIDIGDQRAYLLRGGQVAFETPISTAQAGRWTPRGTYSITEKVRSGKMSTIYNCALPGWMRVGGTAVGMHEGQLPGYPASHGCIRMPIESALFIFDHAPQGTTVQIVDQWAPPAAAPAGGALVAQN